MTRPTQPSPHVKHARHVSLPDCEDEADTIIRQIIEGRADEDRNQKEHGRKAA